MSRKKKILLAIILLLFLLTTWFLRVDVLFLCGWCMSGDQMAANEQRGLLLAHAVEKFHQDNGYYPDKISDLKPRYIQHVPVCWYGIIPGQFRYFAATDPLVTTGDEPTLCFRTTPLHTHMYSFKHKEWFVNGE